MGSWRRRLLAEGYLLAGDLAAAGAHLTAARAHRESHGENYIATEISLHSFASIVAERSSGSRAAWVARNPEPLF